MKIRLELDDGHSYSAESNPRTFMGLASRIAFERQFGMSPAAMKAWQSLYDNEGNLRDDAELGVLREEWLAFFGWHELRRHDDDVPEWEYVIEHVVACDFGDPENPTERLDAENGGNV